MGAWEDVKAEEERRAIAEAEVFKHKLRSTTIASEEQVGQRGGVWGVVARGSYQADQWAAAALGCNECL